MGTQLHFMLAGTNSISYSNNMLAIKSTHAALYQPSHWTHLHQLQPILTPHPLITTTSLALGDLTFDLLLIRLLPLSFYEKDITLIVNVVTHQKYVY
jgi:hypothetical protein